LKRLAIITTHPIQYYAPLFRLLSKESTFSVRVFYTLGQAKEELHDPDFGIRVQWDVPLLEVYNYTFVNNVSANPGTRSFRRIVNPTLNKEIKAWKADAVLVIGWAFTSHLKALRHFHGKVPVLFRGDSNLIDEPAGFSFKKFLRRAFLKWIYSHVDYALYVGEANKQYYLAHGLKPKKLFFAPHSIDNNRFAANEVAAERAAKTWRAELRIGENETVFLFAGKLTPKKAPELLIKAFLALNQDNTRLIITGNGELGPELKRRYREHKKIIFVPFQNQSSMPVLYRLANIFVLPSKGPGETWGLAVNEAMACSRAVIVSDKCGCAADLVQPQNGYVFKSGDLENLKSCMQATLTNYKELGQASYRIIQNYTYSETIAQLKLIAETAFINTSV